MTRPADILFSSAEPPELRLEWIAAPPQFSPDVQEHIDQRWALYQSAAHAGGQSLFNGPTTLYRGHRISGRTLTLLLSPGDYKTHVVTAMRDVPWFAAHAPESIFPALGNSVLLTSGDQVVLGIRSPRVSHFAGRGHVFGGTLDPLATPQMPAQIESLITHLRNELHEELALMDADMIGPPRLLGLFRDSDLAQPELTWHWATRLSVEELRQKITDDEHAGLMTLPLDAQASANLNAHLPDQLTPLALAAWRVQSGR